MTSQSGDRPPGTPKRGGAGDGVDRSAYGYYVTAGFTFGAVLLVFAGLGYWLDTRLQTLPLLTVIGTVLGGAGGFFHLYRTLNSLRDSERNRP